VILPCHRVIHNDGTLGKYGDDPTWKQRLLRLEGWEPGGETDRLRRATVAGERRPGSTGGGARRAATGE
jgi:alkylated DNA nucleotide flippase Atl1